MIYFISLLCSLCIQFGAVGITPFDYSDYQYSDEIIDIFSTILNDDLNDEFQVVYATPSYAYGYVICPLENYTSAAEPFSCTFNSYITDDNYHVIGYTVTYTNCRVYYNSGGNVVWGDYQNGNTWYTVAYFDGYAPANVSNYHKIMKINEDYLPFIINNVPFVINGVMPDDNITGFPSIGVLSPTGHSSGNPIDTLNGSSINWASMTGHSSGGSVGPSPHSSSTHFSSTTPSPDSNDSKTDSLLYMLGNKLADITENTGAIGDALGGIMYNQVAGVSALFNAISGFNDNVSNALSPPSKEEFSATLQTSEIYASYQNVSSSVTAMTTTLNSVGQQSGYVWEIPLPETWGGTLSFNFSSYLDTNTLNFIRILIGAIMIISTIVFVAHQFPDIIGGGSGGENA